MVLKNASFVFAVLYALICCEVLCTPGEVCGNQTCTRVYSYCCTKSYSRCVLKENNCIELNCGKTYCPTNKKFCCDVGSEQYCTESVLTCRARNCGGKVCSFLSPYCCGHNNDVRCVQSNTSCPFNIVCGNEKCSFESPFCCGTGEHAYCTASNQTCIPRIGCGTTVCSGNKSYCCQEGGEYSCTANEQTCLFTETQCGESLCPKSKPFCCKEGNDPECVANSSACISTTTAAVWTTTFLQTFEDVGSRSPQKLNQSLCSILNCTNPEPVCCENETTVFCTRTTCVEEPNQALSIWLPVAIAIFVLLLLLAFFVVWKCTPLFKTKEAYEVSPEKDPVELIHVTPTHSVEVVEM